jgi:hypothetical protein
MEERKMPVHPVFELGVFALVVACGFALFTGAARPLPSPATPSSPATVPATKPATNGVGEKVPSEDSLIKDLHSLGLVQGRTNIFRSASPVRDLVKGNSIPTDKTALQAAAKARLQHLYDLGIRTIVSFENPDTERPDPESSADSAARALWISLEKQAAKEVGINFVSRPIDNTGKDSLETMSDRDVARLADSVSAEVLQLSTSGGVLFHCAAGHDRAGIVAAYIRLKYQQWPVDQAIEEMRRLGHNWVKYSNNGGVSSWHEDHLRAIAALLTK